MGAQMPKQLDALGGYSERLAPYVRRGLLPIPQSAEGRRLLSLVDPWSYRERLTMPKLIVNGSNDFYWVTDALNNYWQGLPGSKWILYVPNTGHDLLRPNPESFNRLLNGLAAFSRQQMAGKTLPELSWRHEDSGDKARLVVESSPAPLAARLWVAESPSRDFRTAEWRDRAVDISGGRVVGEVTTSQNNYLAFFAELDYEIDGLKYQLSTQIRITGRPTETQ
jgi:PhoPQ-activated pathogenicity-related protein